MRSPTGSWKANARRGQQAGHTSVLMDVVEIVNGGRMMATTLRYGFGTMVDAPFPEAVERTKAALKAEGFGILSEIDVQATLREKLDVTIEPYIILGACNPPLAHRAIAEKPAIGLLLPCNVVVHADRGRILIEAADPQTMLSMTSNGQLNTLADEATQRLTRAIRALGTGAELHDVPFAR